MVVIATDDFADQGWEVSDNIAYHTGCNSGFIKSIIDLSSDSLWTFKYTLLSVESGTVNIVVDGVAGVVRNAAGTYEEQFTNSNPNAVIQFFATGISSLKLLQIYPPNKYVQGTTLAFNEDADKWVTYYSFVPEMMLKFVNSFYTFRDGNVWEHNVNEIRNNFYGVQYASKITFYVNLSPMEVKNYYSMRQKSNSVWTAANKGDIFIFPSEGKPAGQSSRLKASRFKRLQTDYFSDFLRDMNDSRFMSEEEALFKGAQLQGNLMRITLENNSTSEVRMLSVDIITSKQDYTY